MSKFSQYMKHKYKNTSKKSFSVYLVLRLLVIISLAIQLVLGSWWNAFLCVVALVLFTLPTLISEKFNIGLPNLLETVIYCFIFSATVLGEINNFYGKIPFWDTMLHTINGFLCAGIGFSLIDLLNRNSKRLHLSPIYVALVAFCFSMTVGVLWEFYEFSADVYFHTDMQKDKIVSNISSVELNEKKENIPIQIDNIEKTEIYTADGKIYTIHSGYLDIGIHDTMKDLFVNLIGAIIFSITGFLYIINRDKYKFAENFIPVKNKTRTK